MTLARWAHLVLVNLRRDHRGALFSAFGVAVGVGALVFFVALGAGVNRLVRERIFPVDARSVEVVAPAMSLRGLLGGGRLDEQTAARLAALPGVERLYRKMEVRIPAMGGPSEALVRSFRVPRNIWVAVAAVGVEPGLVEADLAPGVRFEDPGESRGAIPALAARRLLDVYNRGFARSQGLMPIGEELLKASAGVELLEVRLGRSMRGPTGHAERTVAFSFAGLSDRAPLHGVLIPLETARRLNRAYGQDAEQYSAITLQARSPGAVPALIQEVRRMGLAVDDGEQKLAERVGASVAVTTAALALLSALICLLAAANIAHALSASVRARSRELGLLRAVGATRRDVALLVLGEAGAIGLAGGIAGSLGARLLAWALDALASAYLPEFPFRPESFFAFSGLLFAGAAALGVAAALGGALLPAAAASRQSPARALAA